METAIQKIQASINRRQLPSPSPLKTSTSTLRGEQLNDHQRQSVNLFYARIKTVYGSKYKATFPSDQDERLSKMEWAGQVMNLTPDDVERGIGKLKQRIVTGEKDYQWPNVPLIAALCQPQPEDYGLPAVETARTEAEQNSHQVDRHPWSHEAVRVAGKRTGWFDIMSCVDDHRRRTLKKQFERHYQYLVREVMEDRPLDGAPMLLENHQPQNKSLTELLLEQQARQLENEMKDKGINPAGGRAEYLKRMKGVLR